MTKFLAILTVAVSLALCRPAQARLGQTQQEVTEEMGKPVKVESAPKTGESTCVYQFKKFGVVVTFINGKSQQEIFLKTDGSELTAEDLAEGLKLNVGESKWIEAKGEPPVRGWTREDGKAR